MSAQSELAAEAAAMIVDGAEAISHQIGEGDIPEPVRAFIQERIATELAVSADLYAELQNIVSAYEGKTFGTVYEMQRALPDARATLRRARGEQP